MSAENTEYFIEIGGLQFEDLSGVGLPETARDSVEPWLARGTGVLARLHNRGDKPDFYDYIIITDDAVYFAVLAEGDACEVRSFKGFRNSDVIAFAFVLGPNHAGSDPGEVPQLRLMFRSGFRVKLTITCGDGAELIRRLQRLSAQNPFKR